MSSANKFERGKLEEEFQRRMHDAEVEPAPDLWNRIDHELTVKENREYKDRLFIYKRLAAACFVLFMLAGGLLMFNYQNELAPPAATVTAPANSQAGVAATVTPAENTSGATAMTAEAALAESASAGSIATTPAPRPAEAVVAAGEKIYTSKKASAQSKAHINAVEQLQSLNSGEASGIAPAAEAAAPTHGSGAAGIAGLDENAAKGERAELNKQAVQQMLRNARSIMSLPKEQKSLKDQLAAASNSNDDKQADAVKKAIETINTSDAKVTTGSGGGNSRMSLGMAYGPAYFNQNIGLPNQMMGTVSRNSLDAQGPRTSTFAAANMEAARNEFEDNTDAAFSYAVEARTGFKLGKHWKLLTGIGYSRNAARTKTSYVIRQYWFRPNTRQPQELSSTIFLPSLNNGFSNDSISVEQTNPFYVNYDYRLLSVPLGLQYEGKIGKDWYWYAATGVAANFNLGSEIKASSAEIGAVRYSSRDNDSPFRKVQFSGNVGAGIGKRVSESVMIVIGPEFRSFFSPMLAHPDDALAPQGKPFTVGVNMGIQYTLGKK